MRIVALIALLFVSTFGFGQAPIYFGWGYDHEMMFDNDSLAEYIYVDTSFSSNIWQIGVPQKSFLDSSYSIPNGIITDTINSYPTNNFSVFQLKLIYVPGGSGNYLEFMTRYDCDDGLDGGTIELSYDDGLNWINILEDSTLYLDTFETQFGFTMTDTVKSLGGKPGFTGQSNGWEFFRWNFGMAVDSMLVRFVFASDSTNTNKDGWVIDNIRIYTILEHGVEENNKALTKLTPNPSKGHFTINTTLQDYKLQLYNAQGQAVTFTRQGNSISITNKVPGIYLLRILQEGQCYTKRLVVE